MLRAASLLLLALLTTACPATAQAQSLLGRGGLFGGGKKLGATAVLIPGDQPGMVSVQVKVTIPDGSNTYSQDPSFERPTKVIVDQAADWQALDPDFFPDHPPKRGFDENFQKEVEKYTGEVVYLRRYRLPAGLTAESASLEGLVDLLVCDAGNCTPHKLPFTARLGQTPLASHEVAFPAASEERPVVGAIPPEEILPQKPARPAPEISPAPASDNAVIKELTPQRGGGDAADPIKLRLELAPKNAQPGENVTVTISMSLGDGWSVQALTPLPNQIELPTRIELQPHNLKVAGEFTVEPAPRLSEVSNGPEPSRAAVHSGQVSWRQTFTVIGAGPFSLDGSIQYQLNQIASAIARSPHIVEFTLEGEAVAAPSAAAPGSSGGDGLSDVELAALFPIAKEGRLTFASALWGAFFAGLIMNVMPCVLPVLSIKILSFAQQAGESRGRIMGLNLAYTLGVLAVFSVLAISAVGIQQAIARGEQVESINRVLLREDVLMTMGAVFFVMGLSLMGVFELPVPGIIPSAGHHQEGYLGAFTTGIVATILGTPCIAPFIGPVFVWTVLQSVPVIFLTFSLMALGMASPYLVTSVFPRLVNWLPRPGMWMVRFKQFTGFVMLGTVLFLMASIDLAHLIPYLIILLALGLAAWMVGTYAPPTLSYPRQFTGWVLAVACAAPLVWYGLREMENSPTVGVWGAKKPETPAPGELHWQPFSEDSIVALRRAGQPMIIDFTANWCVICKANERLALNTDATSEFVDAHGFTAVVADFTTEDARMLKWLRHFGQESVPLTIIVPPGADSQVIVLAGAYFQGGLLAKLEEALKSGGVPAATGAVTAPDATARKEALFGETL